MSWCEISYNGHKQLSISRMVMGCWTLLSICEFELLHMAVCFPDVCSNLYHSADSRTLHESQYMRMNRENCVWKASLPHSARIPSLREMCEVR